MKRARKQQRRVARAQHSAAISLQSFREFEKRLAKLEARLRGNLPPRTKAAADPQRLQHCRMFRRPRPKKS